MAGRNGYVQDSVDPSELVSRAGVDFSDQPLTPNDLDNWRAKFFLIWFCFIYENFQALAKPMGAIEELVMEFKAPSILDLENARLGSMYAGASASDPLTPDELQREAVCLKPHYEAAVALLDSLPRLKTSGDKGSS
jgi:hypothetical protein